MLRLRMRWAYFGLNVCNVETIGLTLVTTFAELELSCRDWRRGFWVETSEYGARDVIAVASRPAEFISCGSVERCVSRFTACVLKCNMKMRII
jgi:hypothetical protein